MQSVSRWITLAGRSFNQHSPAILTGAGVTGVVITAALAVKATPAAMKVVEAYHEEEKFLNANDPEPKPRPQVYKEIFFITAKFYLPAALSGVATIACVIGANQIGARRQAAVAGAYTLVDTAFREYKDEVLEQLGKNKERVVQDEVIKKQMAENPVEDRQVIITGGGDQLCFESLTGRYFQSDVEEIRRAENDLNGHIIDEMYVSLNDWFDALGLDHTDLGAELGWTIENRLDVVFSPHLASNGKPCVGLAYSRLPRKDYGKF